MRVKKIKNFFLEISELTSQQRQAVMLANPFIIPMHRKGKVKKIRGQRLRVHR